jgi:hypothetical protein
MVDLLQIGCPEGAIARNLENANEAHAEVNGWMGNQR